MPDLGNQLNNLIECIIPFCLFRHKIGTIHFPHSVKNIEKINIKAPKLFNPCASIGPETLSFLRICFWILFKTKFKSFHGGGTGTTCCFVTKPGRTGLVFFEN
jgi:hypothetical protein